MRLSVKTWHINKNIFSIVSMSWCLYCEQLSWNEIFAILPLKEPREVSFWRCDDCLLLQFEWVSSSEKGGKKSGLWLACELFLRLGQNLTECNNQQRLLLRMWEMSMALYPLHFHMCIRIYIFKIPISYIYSDSFCSPALCFCVSVYFPDKISL